MKFKNGQTVMFTSTEAKFYTAVGTIIRPLNGEECDILDVGPMYLISIDAEEGVSLEQEAFEDELKAQI